MLDTRISTISKKKGLYNAKNMIRAYSFAPDGPLIDVSSSTHYSTARFFPKLKKDEVTLEP